MIIKGLKKYALVVFLLFSFTISTNTAVAAAPPLNSDDLNFFEGVAAAVEPYGSLFTGIGLIFSANELLNSGKHDAMIESYFKQIMAAIDQINIKLDRIADRIITNNCNIYQHSIGSSQGSFRVRLETYLITKPEDRYKNNAELISLAGLLPDIIAKFEDPRNQLKECKGLNQFHTLTEYLLLSNIDLSIRAAVVRQQNYLFYRKTIGTSGQLEAIATMDPIQRQFMEDDIIQETRDSLIIRLNSVINHLKVLDGINRYGVATAFSWKKSSDTRFNITSSQSKVSFGYQYDDMVYKFNNQDYFYSVSDPNSFSSTFGSEVLINTKSQPDGVDVSLCHFVYTGSSSTSNQFCNTYVYDPTSYNSDQIKSFISKPTTEVSKFPVEFDYLNIKFVNDYYQINPQNLFSRIKYDNYIRLVKSELVTAIRLLNQWIIEVGDPSIIVPELTAINDANSYSVNSIDPKYHNP